MECLIFVGGCWVGCITGFLLFVFLNGNRC